MIGILQKAPDFKADAVAAEGKVCTLHLDDFKGRYLVLFFYPLDFTFVCPTEIMAFSSQLEQFKKLNAAVVGASCDSVYAHKTWLGQLGELGYPLIADYSKELAQAYQVLLPDGFPARATFVIDPEGVIQHISLNNPNIGRSVTEIRRVLEALQTGSLCPVEWKQGDKTL